MVEQLYTFDPWNRHKALTYHRVFHYSVQLQFNHLIFLHTYLLGIGVIVATGGWTLSIAVAAVYIAYSCFSIRPLFGAICYSVIVLAIFCVGSILNLYLHSTLTTWTVAFVGVGIVLASFLLQLLGHYFHEEFFAPPSLMHGLVAAPSLEAQWLLLIILYRKTEEYNIIMEEVLNSRKLLAADKSKLEYERPLVSNS
jgi:hypothetical protein